MPELNRKPFRFLKHGFSTKMEGNMSYKYGDPEQVLANRCYFFRKLGVTFKNCVFLTPEEKESKVCIVDQEDAGKGTKSLESAIKADALITGEKGIALVECVADCLPIFLVDKKQRGIALIHVSFKNAAEIIEKTTKKMIDFFDCQAGDLVVFIGPSIKKESYKLKPPFLQEKDISWEPFLKKDPQGLISVDLAGYAINQFVQNGIRNLVLSDIDTAKNESFFSHYRDKKNEDGEGRFAAVLLMKKDESRINRQICKTKQEKLLFTSRF